MTEAADKYKFKVTWEPFLLRPEMPKEGVDKPAGLSSISHGLRAVAETVGVDFTDKCPKFPNTLQAHALLEHVKSESPSKQNELMEHIFQAYFTDGLPPNDDTLIDIATQCDLDREVVKDVISSEDNLKEAFKAAMEWRRKGVNGVPMFLMNGQRVFSGAQEPANFLQMFDVVSVRFPLEENSPPKHTL